MIGSDLGVLEQRKAEAIANEDFESAKALKLQVDKLRMLVDNLDPYNPFK
jgi:UvrB/uvrC motif